MKDIFTVVLAMAAIIAAQVGLTYTFDFQVGETFSKTAVTALFFYFILRSCRKKRQAAAQAK